MPRQARLDAPGTMHHVMIRGIEKRRIVDDAQDRQDLLDRMGKIAIETGTIIYAWALLHNHVHILLKTGPVGISKFMHRLLAGYAIYYNRRHKRHGHLFQNRYKSIIIEEDAYFMELVRYIHLNPIRANLVGTMKELNRYEWCGHRVLLGHRFTDWQDRDYVLGWFGITEGKAKTNYLKYIEDGISQGKRPELTGGGLIRSVGGWGELFSLLLSGIKNRDRVAELIVDFCVKAGINPEELKSGSRRGKISAVRAQLTFLLISEYGLPLAEIGRQLGVSTSAISKLLSRKKNGEV